MMASLYQETTGKITLQTTRAFVGEVQAWMVHRICHSAASLWRGSAAIPLRVHGIINICKLTGECPVWSPLSTDWERPMPHMGSH